MPGGKKTTHRSFASLVRRAFTFQEVIRQVTTSYEDVNTTYNAVNSQQDCQGYIVQLPPDLVISGEVHFSDAFTLLVAPSEALGVKPPAPTSPLVISITDFWQRLSDKNVQENWFKLKDKLLFEGREKEYAFTGDSRIAYLPFLAKDDTQAVRIWIGIGKDKVTSLETKLDIKKGYDLTFFAKEVTTFTTQLAKMGFDKHSCLSIAQFQQLYQKRYHHLHTAMRHNDLHCGNVLAAGRSVKIIDVGDMERDLLASDIARLEVSLWFELSKQLSKTFSQTEAETILKTLLMGEVLSEKPPCPIFILSLLLHHLKQGFCEGMQNNRPDSQEIELAYIIQILLYQRYCLLDGLEEIPPAFNVFVGYWFSRFQRVNPYVGLSAFQEADAARFFGRETLTEKLFNKFSELWGATPRLLAIIGPSGSGKSSVACAGLVPALKHRLLPGLTALRVEIITPTEHPVEILARLLARIATQHTLNPDDKNLQFEHLLNTQNGALKQIVATLPNIDTTPLVILIDQFEETYSLCKETEERTAFIDNLMVAVQDTTTRLSVILALRSDFLGETQRHSTFNHTITDQAVLVPSMNKEELSLAISKPAEWAGQALDAATVELLIKDTEGQEGTLPLLQFALMEIWEGMKQGIAPVDKFNELGGVGGALAKKAEALYQQLPEADKNLARRAFLKLVQLGEGTKDTRRRVNVRDMVAQGETEQSVKAILDRFSHPEVRLITLSTADQEITAEVTHEALLGNWKTLKDWLDKSRDDLRFEYRLDEAAKYWDAQQKEKGLKKVEGLLWRSPDLDLLLDFQHREKITETQVTFFKASVRQQRKKTVVTGAIATLIFVLLSILGVPTAWEQIKQAKVWWLNKSHYTLADGKSFRDNLKDGGKGPEMVWVPAGTFKMGYLQGSGDDDGQPVHDVSVRRFAIGRYEVTFEEYDKFAEATDRRNPFDKGWGRDKRPVINVDWYEVTNYVKWLSKQTGMNYRLPTEAEWEYVARAGTETKYWWGNDIGSDNANCGGRKTVPVGSFYPNSYGLYDTVGNVWEWVADPWHDSYKGAPTDGSMWEGEGYLRVLRGGSFNNDPNNCRAAFRDGDTSGIRDDNIGFRVAVSPVAWTE